MCACAFIIYDFLDKLSTKSLRVQKVLTIPKKSVQLNPCWEGFFGINLKLDWQGHY